VEKDNGVSSGDRRASGLKNAANVSRVIHLMALSWIEKKVSAKLARFVSEKMKENEPWPEWR
jgi:hypothetical protein